MIWNYVAAVWSWVMNNLIIINLILSVVIVFFQRRKPETVWTWLLVLYFIPIAGFILYLVIGQDMHKRRMFQTKEIEDELNSAIRKQEETIYSRKLELNNPNMERFEDLILYNLEAADAVYTADNEIEIYTDGREKFDALIAEMKKRGLIFIYSIILSVPMSCGRKLNRCLWKRAGRGWKCAFCTMAWAAG